MARRCYGCMKIKGDAPVCEHCGYREGTGNDSHQLPEGTLLQGQYLIGRVLGQGGFGITYIGWDTALDQAVAIKEYFPNSFVTRTSEVSLKVGCAGERAENLYRYNRDKFLKEAKTLAKLRELPGVVRVQKLFEENNSVYMVMEYLQGMTLKSFVDLQEKHLTPKETLSVLEPVMHSLSKVHGANLIHRDISPDNIMLLGTGRVKLLDFGAAREVENPDVAKEILQSTEAILKHGFAPPEQYQKVSALGPWSDVYALCATIYYCMTGQIPSSAPERIMGDDNLDWKKIPGLTPRQILTLEQGMALLPEKRIPSMEALWDGLLGAGSQKPVPEEPVQEPEKEPQRPEKKSETKKKPLGLIAAGLAAVATAGVLFALRSAPLQDPEPQLQMQETVFRQTIQPSAPAETEADPVPTESLSPEQQVASWEDNLLMSEMDQMFVGITKEEITEAAFLDTTAAAPANAWDVSQDQSGRVLAWVEQFEDGYRLYITADGGINGAGACRKLFQDYKQLRRVDFGGCFHTEQETNMYGMFRRCTSLISLDLRGLDTSQVVNMSAMFDGCKSLSELDLTGVDTAQVTNMSYMFNHCESLTTLDVSGFDTAKAENMGSMFAYCKSLKKVNLQNFNTLRVTDMGAMFNECTSLIELDLSGFQTGRVTNMSYMFSYCTALSDLRVYGFNTSSVTDMTEMFLHCESLTYLDLGSFDFSSVTQIEGIFNYCINLTGLNIRWMNAIAYTDGIYRGCYKLPEAYKQY